MTVHFWPHILDINTASFRLRCLRVMEKLGDKGIKVALYNNGDAPTQLVLSKRYDPLSIQKAIELKKKWNTKLYLDICDNHFYHNKPEPKALKRAGQLLTALQSVDVIIASSEYLAEIIANELNNTTPIIVIGDLVDFPYKPSLSDKLTHPIAYLQLKTLEFIFNHNKTNIKNRLVWFGNHSGGGGYADCGMHDIESIRLYLEIIHEQTPISLTIISNSWRRYRSLTKNWIIPTFYLPWDKNFFSSALSLHDIAVIPINKNPFTMAKTSNRVETSLAHGLQVIADQIPSYIEYKPNIYLGEWEKNLSELITHNNGKSHDLNKINFEERNFKTIQAWEKLFDK